MLIALLRRIEDVVLTGPVLQEILQAFRYDSQFTKVTRYFRPFDILELQRADYIEAAELHRRCASSGVAASTVDCQIAIVSIKHDCFLLTADKNFQHIAKHCELKLL